MDMTINMKTNRILAFFVVVICISMTAMAEEVKLQQARQKAIDFVTNRQHVNKRHAARAAEIDVKVAESQAAFHVFNIGRDDGFVIVGGDDRMPDILGYSDNGHYIADSIPCNMRGWMEGYTEQLAYLKAHPDAMASPRKVISGESIAPMLECKWNQWSPYNDQCPEGCPTGCTATAMAQIMYYYQWPKQTTKPIPSYTTSLGITIPSIEVTEIDWENMLPTYNSSSPDISKQAVATLMKLCGASVRIDYSPDGSGAYISDGGQALMHFFNFEPDFEVVYRKDYNENAWNQIIYGELKQNRPVPYAGYPQKGGVGHAFVLDGYDGNNYFHVNWGWGGKYDGYFLLSALEVVERDYTANNIALLNLRPALDEKVCYYYVIEDDVLTYYFDENKSQEDNGNSEELTSDDKEKIKKIVISSSFENQEVISVSKLFKGFQNLEIIEGLNYLCTSNVTNMRGMFSGCYHLTSLDLSHFNTSKVTDMCGMFSGCDRLRNLDLSHFDTSKVTDMSKMFYDCSSLSNLDLSCFDTSNVRRMSKMFNGCSSLTGLDLSNFDTSNIIDMSSMFSLCSSLTSINLSHFDTSNALNMSSLFFGCSSLTNLDLSDFVTSNVVNMSKMFYNCSSLSNLDLSCFDTSNTTRMHSMFLGCSSLTSLDLSNFNTSSVTTMNGMFSDCSSLTSLDLSNFDTSNVTDMCYMFDYCSSLTNLDLRNFDTSKVNAMREMFSGCSSLTSLDLSNFETVNVTTMEEMFSGCSSLTSLDLSNFNTSSVIYMNGMFSFCSSLTNLDLSHFDTSHVTYMGEMFSHCSSLPSLDLSHFDTSNVTYMGEMFSYCSSLTSLDLSSFDTSNVTVMYYMFNHCSSLSKLDLTNFNTKNISEMRYMFEECSMLKTVIIGKDMSVIQRKTFENCPILTDVYCLAETVPNAPSNAFYNSNIGNATLHVPEASLTAYQAQSPWNLFKEIIGIGTSANIVDGDIYDNDNKMDNINVIYTRTFNNTNWQALYVPFAMSYDDWKDDFDVAEINNFHEYDDNEDGKVDRTVLEILYVKEGSTLPNTPYLIRAKETGTKVISLANTTLYAAEENSIDCSSVRTKYTFTGTYTGMSGEEMYSNGYYALAGGTLSQPSSANVSLGSFRWYLKPESRTGNYAAPRKISVRVIGEADGETTSIAEATMNDRQEEYYNLEGVRISKAEATGVYIVRYADGRMKKVIKK